MGISEGWQGLVAMSHVTAGLDQGHHFSNCVPEDTALENAEGMWLQKLIRSSVLRHIDGASRTILTAPIALLMCLRHSAAKPSYPDFINTPTYLSVNILLITIIRITFGEISLMIQILLLCGSK